MERELTSGFHFQLSAVWCDPCCSIVLAALRIYIRDTYSGRAAGVDCLGNCISFPVETGGSLAIPSCVVVL